MPGGMAIVITISQSLGSTEEIMTMTMTMTSPRKVG